MDKILRDENEFIGFLIKSMDKEWEIPYSKITNRFGKKYESEVKNMIYYLKEKNYVVLEDSWTIKVTFLGKKFYKSKAKIVLKFIWTTIAPFVTLAIGTIIGAIATSISQPLLEALGKLFQ